MSSFGLTSSSIEIKSEGKFWVMILLTLGEPRLLEVGEANPEVGVTIGLVSGSEISGSSANLMEGKILRVTSENEIGSWMDSFVCIW